MSENELKELSELLIEFRNTIDRDVFLSGK